MADKTITTNQAAPGVKAAATPVVVPTAAAVAPIPAAVSAPVEVKAAPKPPVLAETAAAKVVAKPVTPKAAAPKAPEPKVLAAKAVTPVAAPVTKPAAQPVKKIVSVKTQAKPVAAPAAPHTKKEVTTMENTIKNTTDKAQAMFVDMNDRAKAALEKTQGMLADVTEFNKGNVEALVESSKIAAKGIETMGQDAAEYTRKSFENMTAIVKTLSTVKSPTEFMKLQSDYMRTSFDSMVAESSKTTETMLKLAGEIAQPISNRVAIAAEKIKISA
ncbi:MAG: hypothetical protein BVN32_10120 [Proteobacteria bacterium ST_bin14]|nr:MAG: hypothetical protein BVN32_10120 [Proteobacteria bacterium ST_bin14]